MGLDDADETSMSEESSSTGWTLMYKILYSTCRAFCTYIYLNIIALTFICYFCLSDLFPEGPTRGGVDQYEGMEVDYDEADGPGPQRCRLS